MKKNNVLIEAAVNSFRMIYDPSGVFNDLKKNPRSLSISITAFLIMFTVYTGTLVIGAVFTRVKSYLPLLIDIFPGNFYLWIAVIMPVIILLNLMGVAIAYGLAKASKSGADFKTIFIFVNLALTVPWWAGWISDSAAIIGSIITGFHDFPYWALAVIDFFYGVMALATLILVPIAIYKSTGINRTRSILISLAVLIPYWGLMSLLVL